MLRVTVLFLGLVAYCHAFSIGANRHKCWTDGNGENKARYWDNGSELTRGSFWNRTVLSRAHFTGRYYYRCTDGRLEPIGCINDDNQRITKVQCCCFPLFNDKEQNAGRKLHLRRL